MTANAYFPPWEIGLHLRTQACQYMYTCIHVYMYTWWLAWYNWQSLVYDPCVMCKRQTCSIIFSRSKGAVNDLEMAPARPPATRCFHARPVCFSSDVKSGGHVRLSPMSIICDRKQLCEVWGTSVTVSNVNHLWQKAMMWSLGGMWDCLQCQSSVTESNDMKAGGHVRLSPMSIICDRKQWHEGWGTCETVSNVNHLWQKAMMWSLGDMWDSLQCQSSVTSLGDMWDGLQCNVNHPW